jgi:prepilin-type N-terminal cleavage/methylation domain-containing protein
MIKLISYFVKNGRGFSLVEMSIVLVIIGFIASSAISVAITTDYTTKRDETESKLDRIEEALAGYVSTNHRLPCPANGALASSSATFGLEVVTAGAAGNPQTCDSGSVNFTDAVATPNTVYGGVIPIRTLSLPDDFMFDGWGRRIDYVVHMSFANNDLTNTGCAATPVTSTACFRETAAGTIRVNDASGTARTTTAAYVLLSHGENGHGAFPKTGSAKDARINGFPTGNPFRDSTASANEFTNAKVDNAGAVTAYTATFVMRDYTRNDDTAAAANARTYFDDQIRFREKSQIVRAAGGYIYESICKTALGVVNGTATDCTTASDSTQCTTFATEVNSRCLQ